MKNMTILDGHPVPYSLTIQRQGRTVEQPTALDRSAAEKFAAEKGMTITRWENGYAFYAAAALAKSEAT